MPSPHSPLSRLPFHTTQKTCSTTKFTISILTPCFHNNQKICLTNTKTTKTSPLHIPPPIAYTRPSLFVSVSVRFSHSNSNSAFLPPYQPHTHHHHHQYHSGHLQEGRGEARRLETLHFRRQHQQPFLIQGRSLRLSRSSLHQPPAQPQGGQGVCGGKQSGIG